LISFGIDQAALYRLAASYVDRILKGEKPADLPVQAPTKYETRVKDADEGRVADGVRRRGDALFDAGDLIISPISSSTHSAA
jgi:hypothetical protein